MLEPLNEGRKIGEQAPIGRRSLFLMHSRVFGLDVWKMEKLCCGSPFFQSTDRSDLRDIGPCYFRILWPPRFPPSMIELAHIVETEISLYYT